MRRLVLLLILLVASVLAGCRVSPSVPSEEFTPAIGGFSVKYPSGWTVMENYDHDRLDYTVIFSERGAAGIVLDKYGTNEGNGYLSVQGFYTDELERWRGRSGFEMASDDNVKVGGQRAKQFTFTAKGDDGGVRKYVEVVFLGEYPPPPYSSAYRILYVNDPSTFDTYYPCFELVRDTFNFVPLKAPPYEPPDSPSAIPKKP